jgi:APA family basic amino acid/polyamine antiporter
MCVALVIGNTIGSGVFLLPVSLAPYGLNSVLAWLFTTSGVLMLAIVFATLSRAFPKAGGPYAYVELAFGSLAAFIVAWGYWISIWVGNVSIATGAISYLTPWMPWLATVPGASAALTLAVLWILTGVNCYGVKAAGWVQSVTTVLKLLPLIAVCGLGVALLDRSHIQALEGAPPLSLSGTTGAATLALWALLGIESATIPADKVRDPTRTIPRATLVGAIITALICMLACTTVLVLVPAKTLASSNAPFADLAVHYWGQGAGKLVALAAAISGFGALNGWILLQGELPNVMAKHGVFPKMFAHDSARFTPTVALVFTSALVSVLVLINYQKSMGNIFTFMITLSTSACLVLYLFCSLALLRLLWTGYLGARGARAITLMLIGILAAAFSVWALAGAGREPFWWGMALLACGVPIYAFMRLKVRRWA